MISKKTYKVMLLPGDGIGPEVTEQAIIILNKLADKAGFQVEYDEDHAGGAAIEAYNDPMPDAVVEKCKASNGVFLGAVGGEKWDHLTGAMRPESGLLKIRKELGAFANLRPVAVPDSLAEASPLRLDAVKGTDMLVVRELTGGIYFGEPKVRETIEGAEECAYNSMRYTTKEIRRVARVGFEWARRRHNKLCSVDKANVLVVSQLWRDVVNEVHQKEYPEVELSHMYIDVAAMQLVLKPRQFDVVLTGNLFGDILSDAAATLGGSLGLLPSASLGGPVGLYEPVHGSAPDIAGQGIANPIAAILSISMLLDEWGEATAANAIRTGVNQALSQGCRTRDLWKEGYTLRSTAQMGQAISDVACAHIA